MQNFLKKLALLLLIAGLPLQNLHAVSMPMCNQDQQSTVAHTHAAQADDAAEHHHADGQDTSPVNDKDKACDGCNLCQVCSAPALASASTIVLLDVVHTPPPALISRLSLFVPEQLQRPPLHS